MALLQHPASSGRFVTPGARGRNTKVPGGGGSSSSSSSGSIPARTTCCPARQDPFTARAPKCPELPQCPKPTRSASDSWFAVVDFHAFSCIGAGRCRQALAGADRCLGAGGAWRAHMPLKSRPAWQSAWPLVTSAWQLVIA
ncbi:uncharacterized protein UV8b_02149 [Ustilaginoidea virens]|uniref:Uncharacterized protein n=1 Tax=Ustilaginoidea virens TaxID=1159556 RepID=A0A8E5HMB7_USTVR|nr:uncharacterized protein UV8b_02149 [Ustilaginoidea virens]QUC17908.1 hypothetical protein UV8b_02149 [Ustilaginoidea virens]